MRGGEGVASLHRRFAKAMMRGCRRVRAGVKTTRKDRFPPESRIRGRRVIFDPSGDFFRHRDSPTRFRSALSSSRGRLVEMCCIDSMMRSRVIDSRARSSSRGRGIVIARENFLRAAMMRNAFRRRATHRALKFFSIMRAMRCVRRQIA
jgi:hypothetical protein